MNRYVQFCIAAALLILALSAYSFAVKVEDTNDEGQGAFKVTTTNATYYLQKQAGGFSSLVGKGGKDWISANSSSGASGMYRGIPNIVHPGDVFHPMHKHCTCTKKSANSEKVTVECTSSDEGGWALLYEFYDDRADLTLTKKSRTYWFLYEGTPNGKFSGSSNYLYRSDTKSKHMLNKEKTGDIEPISGENHEWIYFSDNGTSRGLLLILHKDDDGGDRYYAMNPMTVFGFGRPKGTSKALKAVPNKFSVLMVETTSWDKIAAIAKGIVEGATAISEKSSTLQHSLAYNAVIKQNSAGSITLDMPLNSLYNVRIVDMAGRLVASRENITGKCEFSHRTIGSGLFYANINSAQGNFSKLFMLNK